MLSVKERQRYLKELGFYNGKIDGIVGSKTKSAYLQLQKKYFTRKKDIDGIYGKNTDILLQNAYNCRNLKYFKLNEFRCKCNGKYCTGYPAIINYSLLTGLDKMREYYNKPIIITSGLRCYNHNKNVGGVLLSRHKNGKAVDIRINTLTSLTNRKNIINYWITNISNSRYAYTNEYGNLKGKISYPKASGMQKEVHCDVN